jgi:hypothetical protein
VTNPTQDHLEPHPLVRGLIFEGIGAAGKTSTAAALRRQLPLEPENERSLIALTETYTQVLNEVQGQLVRLTRLEHLQLLERQIGLLEAVGDHVVPLGARTRRSSGLFFLLERVQLNHRAAFSAEQAFDEEAISRVEDRLVRLGAKCVFLTVSEDLIEDRAIVRRDVRFDSDAAKADAIAEITAQQRWVRAQVQRSRIPTLEVNTNSMDWDDIARTSMRFLESR